MQASLRIPLCEHSIYGYFSYDCDWLMHSPSYKKGKYKTPTLDLGNWDQPKKKEKSVSLDLLSHASPLQSFILKIYDRSCESKEYVKVIGTRSNT